MKITAAMFDDYGQQLHIEHDVEIKDPGANEVRVKIVSCGICHTDMAFQYDEWKLPIGLPFVPGHEGAGIVEKVGPGVTKFKEGDHVVLSVGYCGECDNCKKGITWMCDRIDELNLSGKDYYGKYPLTWHGKNLSTCLGQGSFATYCVQNINAVVKIDDDFDLKIAGPLGCGFRTGAGTVYNYLQPRIGEWVAIFGTGNVGLAAMWTAKAMGARTIMVDVRDARLERAKELGAEFTVNSKGLSYQETAQEIIKIAGGKGVEYVAETTGQGICNKAGAAALRGAGKLAQVSIVGDIEFPGGYTNEVNDRKSISFIRMGNVSGEVMIPVMIDMYKRGLFPYDKICTSYKLEDVNQAMQDSLDGKTFKPVIVFED